MDLRFKLVIAVACCLSMPANSNQSVYAEPGCGVGCDSGCCGGCDSGCDSGCCESGPSCCELIVKEGKKKKHCWKVESKKICIPNVVFPWQKDCCDGRADNGACVKTIRVIKKHKYSCPKCEYKWEAVDDPCGVPTSGCCAEARPQGFNPVDQVAAVPQQHTNISDDPVYADAPPADMLAASDEDVYVENHTIQPVSAQEVPKRSTKRKGFFSGPKRVNMVSYIVQRLTKTKQDDGQR